MKRWTLIVVLLAGTLAAQDKNSSLTVDLVLAGRSIPQVTEGLALFLERGGMDRLELAKPGAPIQTDYKLLAEFDGVPGQGVTGIRASVTDRDGKPVWTTRATPQDEDWKKIGVQEPMQAMVLLLGRLRPVFHLDDPLAENAHQGKFATLMQERSGLPPQAERTAMSPRLEALKHAGPSATLAIYASNGPKLAEIISRAGLARATDAAVNPGIQVAASMNEQKMLWDAARGFRDYLRKHPPAADYALFADYLGTNAVHFIVADRTGEWVIVDFQNEHHPDFQAIAPKTPDDCARLVLTRLQGYLR